jgi:cytochrome b subunit of formate dehydrogenase
LCLTTVIISLTAATAQDDRKAVMERELPKLKDVYRATSLKPLGPETPLSREYYRLLTRYVRYARPNLRDWPREPVAKFHKVDGAMELAVRQNATVALALAVLSECGNFDAKLAGATREEVRADAMALLRYLSVTHKANFLPTGDGKPWGDHWQSAFWAGIAGQAAWLMWDRLDDETHVMVARMVIYEAGRFNTRPPDDGEWSDTKAEENAWNSEVIALARCMFQRHPNAALWHERAIVYMINGFSTKADHEDNTLVDGRRVRDWVTTTCIHPDFTLENHDRVHPDYLGCFSLNLRNAALYKLAGLELPRSMFHHASDCFGVLARLTACNGSFFYVNGQDWWPHRHDVPLMIGGLIGSLLQDRNAAFIERAALDWFKRMHSRFKDGRAFDPREYNYRNIEEEMMARYAELYLLHRLFGDGPTPATRKEFLRTQGGARLFDIGGFVIHRTPAKFASFAWVNGAMGLVYASDDTWFISPDESSLTGRIEIEGVKNTRPKLEARKVTLLRNGDDGFAFVGAFARCGGKIEQRLAMVSLPDAPVVYVERLRARADVKVKSVNTGIVAILNEDAKPIVRNQRRVWTASGEHVMRGAAGDPAKLHVWDTPWANLDDKLGVVAHASGRMTYNENHAYARSRLQQELVANHFADAGPKKAGEIISDAIIGLLPNARHTGRLVLGVERFGADGCGIRFRGWIMAVNLGESKLTGKAFGRDFTIPPMSVEVQGDGR